MESNLTIPSNNGEKTADGRFAKGNSYGTGRPIGSRNKTSLMVESLLASKAEDITHKVVEMALNGDMTALRLCMERLLPPCRERPFVFKLQDITSVDDALNALRTITAGLTAGELTQSECRLLLDMVNAYCETVVSHEVEVKLNAIQQVIEQNTGQKIYRSLSERGL